MASNIRQADPLKAFKYTTTGAVTVGSLLAIGDLVGVALESATGSGQVITVQAECDAVLTKKAAASTDLAVGEMVTYTATGGANKVHGGAATGSKVVGFALAAAVTGATTAYVRLLGYNIEGQAVA